MTLYMQMYIFFFFNDTATTEIYTLSLHDALPIYEDVVGGSNAPPKGRVEHRLLMPDVLDLNRRDVVEDVHRAVHPVGIRSEEHTSELQSQSNLVCRLLLEKKKIRKSRDRHSRPPC